jgi:cytochrome c-type biogenesis protein CcmH
MIRLAVLLSALLLALPAFAADPSEMLKDPALEKRAHALGKELRCLVCQSESIEDSNADLAKDLRIIVREQIDKGASDDQVKKFVVDRYGDYVLLNPPFKGATLVLWLGPFGLLAVAVAAAWAFFRRRATAAVPAGAAPLSDGEKRRLEALLKDGK